MLSRRSRQFDGSSHGGLASCNCDANAAGNNEKCASASGGQDETDASERTQLQNNRLCFDTDNLFSVCQSFMLKFLFATIGVRWFSLTVIPDREIRSFRRCEAKRV